MLHGGCSRWSIIIPSPDPQLSDRPQNYHRPQLSSPHQMSKRSAHNRRIIGGRFVFGQTTPSDPSSPKLPLKRRSMSKQSGIGDNIVKPLNETSDCFSQQLHLSNHTNPQQTTQLKMHERNLKSSIKNLSKKIPLQIRKGVDWVGLQRGGKNASALRWKPQNTGKTANI